jgi:hypothetical protein
VLGIAAASLGVVNPASAAPASDAPRSTAATDCYSGPNAIQALNRGQTMYRGGCIYRIGIADLVLQNDGNLVLYSARGRQCWIAGTFATGHHATYQNDGNFVVYTSGGVAVWSSGTAGRSGSTVDINSAGRVYVGNTAITGPCSG